VLRIELLLLGSLEVRVGGEPVAIGRRNERALLALLACEGERAVSTERIVDELWPENPPTSARHAVEVHVSSLRRALGRERIERVNGGYRLRREREELDVDRFSVLVERSRSVGPGRARSLLEAALGLVRGEPLAGLEGLPFAEVERSRIAELVLAAHEALLDARLAVGEEEALLPELRGLCAAHPTRERLRALLMHALYRVGRQKEALAEYGEARRVLRAELGVEPGPELRDLQRRILRHDPDLAATSAAAPASNVPAPMHPLIGREAELTEVAALLRSDARLITLTGPGGVGKTRLAVALAHHVAAEYAEGAVYAALASVRDPALVVPAIARSTGVDEVAGEPLGETLERALKQRELLLVVDNLEHVLDAAPSLTALLRVCARLAVLATSRTPLRLYGEHVYALEPLELPQPQATAEEIAAAPAVRLFAARARAVQPGFAVEPANARALANICSRLDGLPLAIELAAARASLLTPQLLLQRLSSRLDSGAAARDVDPRHRTLRATIDWSNDLLTDGEQQLLARLSVFADGWTLAAAEQVCDADDALLESLAGHSFVRSRGDRFSMLATIREYAQERLQDARAVETTRRRHAEYFGALVDDVDPSRPGATMAWLTRVSADEANVRAAARMGGPRGAGSGGTNGRRPPSLLDGARSARRRRPLDDGDARPRGRCPVGPPRTSALRRRKRGELRGRFRPRTTAAR
jgi:predicted ATPase/DNA-binding SARP family transcriptional activator